jgi:glycosyltransferase involved in cell wall biosynthesis
MASGLPCIASRTSSIPEIVTDGVNGLLVDTTLQELLGAMKRMSDPDYRSRLARAARTRATEFDWISIAGKYVAAMTLLEQPNILPLGDSQLPSPSKH